MTSTTIRGSAITEQRRRATNAHARSGPWRLGQPHADLATWYAVHGRDLPWRHTRDPYAILVAEVMLQQTQVERVAPKYREFLEAFPTLDSLAAASPGDVIRAWASLGYNARAVRLHRLARLVTREHGGRLPRTEEGLRRLPGVGPYTAAAVACFAFGVATAVLDTNIYRVVSRVAFGVQPPSRSEIEAAARKLLPGGDPAQWHQALMDVGAVICSVRAPRCPECPLRSTCRAAPQLQDGRHRRLAQASVPYSAKQPPFAGSTRFYRGRIIDVLRSLPPDTSMDLQALGWTLRPDFALDDDGPWLNGLLTTLSNQGLVRLHTTPTGDSSASLP